MPRNSGFGLVLALISDGASAEVCLFHASADAERPARLQESEGRYHRAAQGRARIILASDNPCRNPFEVANAALRLQLRQLGPILLIQDGGQGYLFGSRAVDGDHFTANETGFLTS